MKITWYGHSCFRLESKGSSIVIDPYGAGFIPGLGPLVLAADAVLCTHEHADHCNRAAVTLTGRPCALSVKQIDAFHDDAQGIRLGPNAVYVISDGDVAVAHFGDIGHMLPAAQAAEVGHPDVMIVNVGGYMESNAEFAQALTQSVGPRIVIPCHYRTEWFGAETMGTAEDFLRFRTDAKFYPGNSIEITGATKPQTAILEYRPR